VSTQLIPDYTLLYLKAADKKPTLLLKAKSLAGFVNDRLLKEIQVRAGQGLIAFIKNDLSNQPR